MNLVGLSQGTMVRKSIPRPVQSPFFFSEAFSSGLKFKNSAAKPPNQLIESSAPLVREVKSGEAPKSRPFDTN
jgi:hypothetical protein